MIDVITPSHSISIMQAPTCEPPCDLVLLLASGALRYKAQVLALFVIMQAMLTLLIAFQSLSLFIAWRIFQLALALWLRSAIFSFEVRFRCLGASVPRGFGAWLRLCLSW